MTHPTIEKARDTLLVHGKFGSSLSLNCHGAEIAALAAARVTLAAEPSEAEVEAAIVAMFLAQGIAKTEEDAREQMRVDKNATPELHASDVRTMRAALQAANAAKAKEMGL